VVVQPVWQPAVSCKQTSNRLSNRFDNRVERAAVRSAGCQTGLYNRIDNGVGNRLYRVYKHLPGWQPVWQQVVSCKRGLTNHHSVECCNPKSHPRGSRPSWQYVRPGTDILSYRWRSHCELIESVLPRRSVPAEVEHSNYLNIRHSTHQSLQHVRIIVYV